MKLFTHVLQNSCFEKACEIYRRDINGGIYFDKKGTPTQSTAYKTLAAITQPARNISGIFAERCNVRHIQGTFWEHFKGKDFLKSSRWKSCFCVKSI